MWHWPTVWRWRSGVALADADGDALALGDGVATALSTTATSSLMAAGRFSSDATASKLDVLAVSAGVVTLQAPVAEAVAV